jgi:hypothetical protein
MHMTNRNVGTEIAALPRLAVKDLRARYAEIFGEPTKASNKQWLTKRIAWRLQSLAEGDLSERARKRAEELARTVARPISDMRGDAEYRKHLVGVLTRRALRKAIDRAKGR